MKTGKFIMSLDFELFWGVRDKRTIENYGKNILGVYPVTSKMLDLFEKYEVGATYATVGLLFADNSSEIENFLPKKKPGYTDQILSPYSDLENIKQEEEQHHFCLDLINQIAKNPKNEIASHTFSHYYCLEEGQNLEEFQDDLHSAIKVAEKHNWEMKSLVFPRNQFNAQYLNSIKEQGFTSYRGNEESWFYSASSGDGETKMKRAFRLLDTYINISGHNTYNSSFLKKEFPYNLASSRFLRPYSPKLKPLEGLRLKRIKKSMTHAAKNKELFHLWWHPHNFGVNQEENLQFLEEILKHYQNLHKQYGFENVTMKKMSETLAHGEA